MSAVRTEGNVTIVPIVEERLVVTKKLVLVEEIHLTKLSRAQEFTQPVELLRQKAEVERHETGGKPKQE